MSARQVAALFCRADSVYKTLPGVVVFDAARDALTFEGGMPVVAHPPCRGWGRLRGLAKPAPGERELALWAVDVVRRCGGVLEHPEASMLWRVAGLPASGGGRDGFGGWTLALPQFWFGHRARKNTWLYVVGVSPARLPALPLVLGQAPCVVSNSASTRRNGRPEVSRAEREHAPPDFARWLVEVERRSVVGSGDVS